MKDCYEDISRIEKILEKEKEKEIYKYINISPKDAIIKTFEKIEEEKKLKDGDLLYIHYSGHGVKRGMKVNGKVEILSCWMDDKYKVFSSYDLFLLLNDILEIRKKFINLIISSDSCHSGEIDKYLENCKYLRYTFIGTSSLSLITLPNKDIQGNVKGVIVSIFEKLREENKEINTLNLSEISERLFKSREIKNKLIIR